MTHDITGRIAPTDPGPIRTLYKPTRDSHFCQPPCIVCDHLPDGTIWKCTGCGRVYAVRFHGLIGPSLRFHGYWVKARKYQRRKLEESGD
jgi:hypothetical protein